MPRRGGEEVSAGHRRRLPRRPARRARLAGPRPPPDYGSPLRAGDLVLSGALGPWSRSRPATSSTAASPPLGTVTARFYQGGDRNDTDGSRDHRLGQHRHRPDVEDPAPLRDARGGRDGRDRPRLRRPRPRPAPGRRDHLRRRRRASSRCPSSTAVEIVLDATSAGGHMANAAALEPHGQAARRPHAGRPGPVRRPGREPRGAPRRRQREHGHLRRPGDDPDRRRRLPGDPGPLRGDRRLGLLASAPVPAPGPTSTSSPRRPRRPSRPSAAPPAARRSSSSTRPSRR